MFISNCDILAHYTKEPISFFQKLVNLEWPIEPSDGFFVPTLTNNRITETPQVWCSVSNSPLTQAQESAGHKTEIAIKIKTELLLLIIGPIYRVHQTCGPSFVFVDMFYWDILLTLTLPICIQMLMLICFMRDITRDKKHMTLQTFSTICKIV